jgi:hypothetical protein
MPSAAFARILGGSSLAPIREHVSENFEEVDVEVKPSDKHRIPTKYIRHVMTCTISSQEFVSYPVRWDRRENANRPTSSTSMMLQSAGMSHVASNAGPVSSSFLQSMDVDEIRSRRISGLELKGSHAQLSPRGQNMKMSVTRSAGGQKPNTVVEIPEAFMLETDIAREPTLYAWIKPEVVDRPEMVAAIESLIATMEPAVPSVDAFCLESERQSGSK